MGRYQTEASYLKSVLLWLQEYWTGPAARVSIRLEGAASVAALFCPEDTRCTKSTRRDNRSARVLATPNSSASPTTNEC